MIYTLDMLLTELGQALPLGNGERYRRPVVRAINFVLGRIGYEKTASVYPQPFEIRGGVIEPLPDYVLDVLDVGLEAGKMSGERFGQGYHSDNELAFLPTPFGLHFPNKESGTVYLLVESLPVDASGTVLIMEAVYQACYDYAYAKLLPSFPAHPRFSERRVLEADALGMIDYTRAQLNKRNRLAHNRAIRKSQ